MQGDFEYLLDDDGLKHINTQIQRRNEPQGRTPEFKYSNLNNPVMVNCDHWIRTHHQNRDNTGLIRRKTEPDSE